MNVNGASRRNPRLGLRRMGGDGGTALIESCLVMPLLVGLLAGVIDFGMLYRQHSTLVSSLHLAARAATNAGAARSADFLALRSFNASFATLRNITLTKVVIYKTVAEGSSQPVNSTCFTAATPPSGGYCNIYTASQLQSLGSDHTVHFGPTAFSCGSSAWDRYWCPVNRIDQVDSNPDWLGIYVQVHYRSMTGLWLAGGLPLKDRVVMRLEPRAEAT